MQQYEQAAILDVNCKKVSFVIYTSGTLDGFNLL